MSQPASDNWEGVTWDDAELATLRAGARMTLRQKLQWLEEADRLARTLRRARVRYPDPTHTGAWVVAEDKPAGPHNESPA